MRLSLKETLQDISIYAVPGADIVIKTLSNLSPAGKNMYLRTIFWSQLDKYFTHLQTILWPPLDEYFLTHLLDFVIWYSYDKILLSSKFIYAINPTMLKVNDFSSRFCNTSFIVL